MAVHVALSADIVPATVAPLELVRVTLEIVPPAALTVIGVTGLTAEAPLAGLKVSAAAGTAGLLEVDGAGADEEEALDELAGALAAFGRIMLAPASSERAGREQRDTGGCDHDAATGA